MEFPHSEILGYNGCQAPPPNLSQPCHVLLRLLESRHPPCALKFLIRKFKNHNLILSCYIKSYATVCLYVTYSVSSVEKTLPFHQWKVAMGQNDPVCSLTKNSFEFLDY